MSDKQQKSPKDLPEFDLGDDALPPLDGDETQPPDNEVSADFVGVIDDDDSPLTEDGSVEMDADEIFEEYLSDPGNSSLVDEPEYRGAVDVGMDMHDQEEGWSEEGADAPAELSDDWFVDDYGGEPPDTENGTEGTDDDGVDEIDRSQWDALENPATSDDDESPDAEQSMESLGIELPGPRRDEPHPSVEVGPGVLMDRQFLGPEQGFLRAAAIKGGGLVAVGDGIFAIGADGMLHNTTGSDRIADLVATSVCVYEDSVFVGTQLGGALVAKDGGRDIFAINRWCDAGLSRRGQGAQGPVSTSFHLAGQQLEGRFRLFGRTGEGQLFVSDVMGQAWNGPLTTGRCLAVAPVEGTSEVAVLVESDRSVSLLRSEDLKRWEKLALPTDLAAAATTCPVQIAANADTVAIAVRDPAVPLYCSLTSGRSWTLASGVAGTTAVALDKEEPGWIAAAVYRAENDLGVVRVSEDGGLSWQTVLVTGNRDIPNLGEPGHDNEPRGQVRDLIVDTGGTRRIYAVTTTGVYMVVLARYDMSH